MHDVLVACQELEQADVESYRSGRCSVPVASPADPSSLKAMVTVHDMDQDQPFAAPAEVSVSIAVAVDGEHVADKSLSSIAVAVGGEHVVASAAAPLPPPSAPPRDISFAALTWTTGIHDDGIIAGLMDSLPAWVLEERVMLYEAREQSDIVPTIPAVAGKIECHTLLL
jgi:hypothetical protein